MEIGLPFRQNQNYMEDIDRKITRKLGAVEWLVAMGTEIRLHSKKSKICLSPTHF